LKTYLLIIGLIIIIIILIIQLRSPNIKEERVISTNNPALPGHEFVTVDIVQDWMKFAKEIITFIVGIGNLYLLRKKVKA